MALFHFGSAVFFPSLGHAVVPGTALWGRNYCGTKGQSSCLSLTCQTQARTKPKVRIPVSRCGCYNCTSLAGTGRWLTHSGSKASINCMHTSCGARFLSNITCCAKLNDFTPLRNNIIAINLLRCCLHCYCVFCSWAQEPVPADCHWQRNSFGHQFSGYILMETKRQNNTQVSSATKPIYHPIVFAM